MDKLPKEFKEKWVAALRSGEYKQGESFLKNTNDEYCCLGVGCLVAYNGAPPLDILGEEWISPDFELVPIELRGDGSRADMPYLLSNMNDGSDGYHKHTFAEIADYIEQNL